MFALCLGAFASKCISVDVRCICLVFLIISKKCATMVEQIVFLGDTSFMLREYAVFCGGFVATSKSTQMTGLA